MKLRLVTSKIKKSLFLTNKYHKFIARALASWQFEVRERFGVSLTSASIVDDRDQL